jgi:UDP-glucose 4-epimerase
MGRVLVTGATGFIGAAALAALQRGGHIVRATWHRRRPAPAGVVEWHRLDLAAADDDLARLMDGVDTVVHLAARAHVTGPGRLRAAPFFCVNADGTRRLAEQARRAGVRRFVFLGTVGVHGSESDIVDGAPRPLRANDPIRPADAYAASKAAAERAVAAICTGAMAFTILRAPLVFGPGTGGNFLRLVRHLDRGWPLPVGPWPATRTLVYAENLGEALATTVAAPAVTDSAFLLGDFDVTVTDLAAALAGALGRRLRTVRLPAWMLRGRALRSLTRPLLADSTPFRVATGWQPRIGIEVALARTVQAYRGRQ